MTYLVTGAAGFIGSHICRSLLDSEKSVIGLDNLSTGKQANIAQIIDHPNFTWIDGDITNKALCIELVEKVDYVIHQAALAAVVPTGTVAIDEFLLRQ